MSGLDWRKRKRGKPKVCPHVVERMRALRADGWTYRAIALELGLSEMTVYRWLRVKPSG